ncbi:hypothetical protein V6N13_149248 [Hibiscus sabdariffa]
MVIRWTFDMTVGFTGPDHWRRTLVWLNAVCCRRYQSHPWWTTMGNGGGTNSSIYFLFRCFSGSRQLRRRQFSIQSAYDMRLGFTDGGVECIWPELWGIGIGLSLAWDRGFRCKMVESDCLETVRMLHSSSLNDASITLVRDICRLCSQDWQVSFNHVLRTGNRLADALANLADYSSFDFYIL